MDYREFCNICNEHLLKATKEYGLEFGLPPIEESEHADAASTVSFLLSKLLKKNPADVSNEIVGMMGKFELAGVTTAGPYVNFNAGEGFFSGALRTILLSDGKPEIRKKNGRVILEHTSSNPTGPLHVGRGRNPIIGDTLLRMLRRTGWDVEVHYYVNDMGRQVATIVWGWGEYPIIDSELVNVKPDQQVVDIYRWATAEVDTRPEVEVEIGKVLSSYEAGDQTITEKFDHLVDMCLLGQRQTLERLNVSYDRFYKESELVRSGAVKLVLEKLNGVDESQVKDGARELDLIAFGIEKPFIYTRNDGTTLYTTRDVAYHLDKLKNAERVIDVLGEDQKLAMEQLSASLKLCGQNRLPEFVFYSFVKLPEGKMSTRKGTVVNLDDLLDEAYERAMVEVEKRRPEYPDDKKHKIAEAVSMAAVRFDIVRVSPEKGITFDWSRALDFEQQGAPFVQYSHARACSILRRAQDELIEFDKADALLLKFPSERKLILKLSKYGWVLEAATRDLKPNVIAGYARELAEEFNAFYRDAPVLQAEHGLREARLLLVECTRMVLADVLDCLGITALEEM